MINFNVFYAKMVFTEPEVKILKLAIKHIIPSQISMIQKMTLLDQKWPILTFKCIFYAKMAFTGPEVDFLDLKTNPMALKTLFAYQEAFFAKPEVTTFSPEVKFLKPEVRPITLTKILMYLKTIFMKLKLPKIAFF